MIISLVIHLWEETTITFTNYVLNSNGFISVNYVIGKMADKPLQTLYITTNKLINERFLKHRRQMSDL